MPPEGYATFWEHAEEFRRALIKVFSTIGIGILVSLIFYQHIFEILTWPLQYRKQTSVQEELTPIPLQRIRYTNEGKDPLLYQMPPMNRLPIESSGVEMLDNGFYRILPGGYLDIDQLAVKPHLVLLGPVEGLLSIMRISMWTGLIGTSPLWLYFILQFIAPALRESQRRFIGPFIVSSLLFMAAGFCFAFFFTIPIANGALSTLNLKFGENFWTLSNYLDYSVVLLFANGIAFELAVILFFLVHLGLLSSRRMSDSRRAVIVAIFILSAILTPPDVLSLFLLAIPLMGIYELAILYARFLKSKKKRKEKMAI